MSSISEQETKKCIICEAIKPVSQFNEEHIIPESLGNKVLKIYNVCKKCNELMGAKIDSELTNNIVSQMFRQLKKIPGKSGRIPNPFSSGIDEDGRVVNVDDNFKPYVLPVEQLDYDDTAGLIKVSGGDFNKMIKAVNKKLSRLNLQPLNDEKIEEIRKSINVISPQPKINYSWTTDMYKLKLAFIKISYEFGYLFFGQAYAEDAVSRKLRNIIYEYIYNDNRNCKIENYVQFTCEPYRQDMQNMAKSICNITNAEFYHMLMTQNSQDGKCLHILIDNILTCTVNFCSVDNQAVRHKAVFITYPNGFIFETDEVSP